MIEVKLPPLAEGVNEAVISYWHIKIGGTVNKDQDLVELATDKATFNMPCPSAGILADILFEEGQTAIVGDVIALIEDKIQT